MIQTLNLLNTSQMFFPLSHWAHVRAALGIALTNRLSSTYINSQLLKIWLSAYYGLMILQLPSKFF